MAPGLRLSVVAFMSPQNQPILIRTFSRNNEQPMSTITAHYIAHTSLDVIEERVSPVTKATECYLGLLYSMEEVAVYGYMTPLRVKIVIAFSLSDSVVKDAEVNTIFKALHMAYYNAVANPFLKLDAPVDAASDHAPHMLVGRPKWKALRKRVDEISKAVGNPNTF